MSVIVIRFFFLLEEESTKRQEREKELLSGKKKVNGSNIGNLGLFSNLLEGKDGYEKRQFT